MQYKRPLTLCAFALVACAFGSARADTVVNIPYSAAQHVDLPVSTAHCIMSQYHFRAPDPPADGCEVDFPLIVPVGATIKQIAILHADAYSAPTSLVAAFVSADALDAPWSGTELFAWISYDSVPTPVERTNLMRQLGRTFPDAFVTDSSHIYHVRVDLGGGSAVVGLEVRYE